MSRIARIVLPGIPGHVTQRGNGRQRVFFDDGDRQLYVDLLREHAGRAGFRVWAYCLMPNHVHLVGLPERERSLADGLGRTHANYARHFNLRTRGCGHVWQARFFSCPLDARHLWRAMAYVERNPVRAGMVERAEQYRWSSAGAHVTGVDRDGLLELEEWWRDYGPERWRVVLETSVGEEALARRVQEASLRGRALGSEEFVRELEDRAGRRLRPLAVGRPRKKAEPESRQMSFENGV
ncbi:MAG: hypothetical protein RL328_2863 [Acidobacteriota bacterium]